MDFQKRVTEQRLRHNKLMLGLTRAVQATFNETNWRELSFMTDTVELIDHHPRLLRSLSFGDEDYGGCVVHILDQIIKLNPDNLEIIQSFPGITEWLEKNDAKLLSDLRGDDRHALESLADTEVAGFDVEEHVHRIKRALADDPGLAVGSTKELLETVFKTILGLHGAKTELDDMPKLMKRAQVALGMDASNTADPAERKLLQGISNVVVGVVELRNLYGTGHGKSQAPTIDPDTAKLVVTAGTAAATYFMRRYEKLKQQTPKRP